MKRRDRAYVLHALAYEIRDYKPELLIGPPDVKAVQAAEHAYRSKLYKRLFRKWGIK